VLPRDATAKDVIAFEHDLVVDGRCVFIPRLCL